MTKQQAAARAAHIIAHRREADALERRAAHAARMGSEARANKWARKAKQMRERANLWESDVSEAERPRIEACQVNGGAAELYAESPARYRITLES